MTDRGLLVGGLVALSVGLMGLALSAFGGLPLLVFGQSGPVRAAAAPLPWEGKATGRIKEFRLTLGHAQWQIAPGKVVQAYAFNGQIPGPELRATEGDTVRVTVTNTLNEATTVHWHGVEVPSGMDGVPRLSQEPIPPGRSFTYEFVATPPGTRWYHSHFNELAQQGGGLVGALIIEPRAKPSHAADREYIVVTGQMVTGVGAISGPPTTFPAPPNGMGGMMGGLRGSGSGRPLYDTFLVNGKAYPHAPPLVVRRGERVRLRLVNTGATESQVLALAGHTLTITHSDGNPLARPVPAEAVYLGVGERADVEFVADHPGRWELGSLMPGQTKRGLALIIVYEGHERDPLQTLAPDLRVRPATYAEYDGPPHPSPPDRVYSLTLSGGMMGSDAWTINGRSYPHTGPLDVRRGERVRLRLFNMSMQDHPMHLHGHTFQVVAIGGRPVDGPFKDTLTLRPMEEYEIEFVANNPGVWLFHCHNLEHMSGGLMTEVHYR